MESSPIAKKLRNIQSISIPTRECKREFDLPHKFPSKISRKNTLGLRERNGTSAITNLGTSKNVKDTRSRPLLITNSIKKLRLKSQDGKDLGEVKVQFLSHENMLNTKTVTFIKANLNHKINKPIKLSIIPSNNTGTLMNSVGLQNNIEKSKTVVKSISFDKLSPASVELSEIQDKNNKIQTQYTLTKVNKINQQDNEKVTLLHKNKNANELLYNVQAIGKNSLLLANKKQNENILTKKERYSNNEITDNRKDSTLKNQIIVNMSNIENSSNFKKHWQLVKSKFPVVRCEKLSVSKYQDRVNDITRSSVNTNSGKSKIDSNLKNDIVEKNITSSKSLYSTKPSKECDINGLTKTINFVQKTSTTVDQDNEKTDIAIIHKKGTIKKQDTPNAETGNLMLVLANDNNVSNENQDVFNDINNTSTSCQNNTISNNNNEQNKELSFKTNNGTNKAKEKTDYNNVCEQEKLSQHWNIIKEALTSVKDDELRAKALQALADCGIGIAKQVPISPPEKLKTVHDSQIQTDVFGLLDLESFVLVKEDTPVLSRIKQTERLTVNPPAIDAETQTQMHSNIKHNNYIDNVNLFPSLNLISMQDTFDKCDLDNYFNEYFYGNTDVNRVKNVLSMPHSLCKKVSMLLETDYKEMRQWDENGMLNIHRAVVNNQLHEVQRLLLVLKASKTSIDILTEDGLTCLELGIKWNSSKDIVKLLLEAGAKPVLSELVHESAVILASKISSPLLPDLLKYVTNHKLLNQVDSLGFAPLHYCALHGDVEGVNALIQAGAEVNLKDNRSGRTPFFHALENNRILVAQKLLENGAIANLPNFSGQTVLTLIDETKSLSIKAALKHIII